MARKVRLCKAPSGYAEDENNTRTQTVLMMMVGGGKFAGIHGMHFGPGKQIRFAAADSKRQGIPWVEYRNNNTGTIRTFVSDGSKPDAYKNLPVYEMQCVDCHNRPTHTFESPERGLDSVLALGELSSSLPFIKKKGVELLKGPYLSQKEAAEKLPAALAEFYKQNYPGLATIRSQDIQQAAQSILGVYNRNVFPDLKVTWGPIRTTWATQTFRDVLGATMVHTTRQEGRRSHRTALLATNS